MTVYNKQGSNGSVYDKVTEQVYQIDYTCVNAGRTIGATKRRVRWRFGFANPQSINEGLQGPHCRGQEHEVILVWSLTSGKQTIICDGQEICARTRPREMTLEFSFPFGGKHVIQITGHAVWGSNSSNKGNSSSKKTYQFQLRYDGKDFFSFYHIYQLGIAASSNRRSTLEAAPKPTVIMSEQVDWPMKVVTTPTTVSSSSVDFFEESSPMSTERSSPSNANFATPPEENGRVSNPSSTYFHNAPVYDSLGSFGPVDAPQGKAMSFDAPSQTTTSTYMESFGSSFGNTSSDTLPPDVFAPPQDFGTHNVDVDDEEEEAKRIADEDVSCFSGHEESTHALLTAPSLDPVDEMVQKLCNLNDITADPEQERKLTMTPLQPPESPKTQKSKTGKSRPKPPSGINQTWYGPQPTLNEIKEVRRPAPPTQEVMKQAPHSFHPQAAAAGAMVIYGAAPVHQDPNSPPPLYQQVGFGVGAQTQVRTAYGVPAGGYRY